MLGSVLRYQSLGDVGVVDCRQECVGDRRMKWCSIGGGRKCLIQGFQEDLEAGLIILVIKMTIPVIGEAVQTPSTQRKPNVISKTFAHHTFCSRENGSIDYTRRGIGGLLGGTGNKPSKAVLFLFSWRWWKSRSSVKAIHHQPYVGVNVRL